MVSNDVIVTTKVRFLQISVFILVGLKVNRQRPISAMRRLQLKISGKMVISPFVSVAIKICKKHLLLKTNNNINIKTET